MYTVIALYPGLGIKKRITEYSRKAEAFEYAGSLRMCETPYVVTGKDGHVLDFKGYEMSREEMAAYIQKYC